MTDESEFEALRHDINSAIAILDELATKHAELLEKLAATQLELLVANKALAAVTKHLDDLVGACLDKDGKPAVPSYRALMSARGALPSTAENSFK